METNIRKGFVIVFFIATCAVTTWSIYHTFASNDTVSAKTMTRVDRETARVPPGASHTDGARHPMYAVSKK